MALNGTHIYLKTQMPLDIDAIFVFEIFECASRKLPNLFQTSFSDVVRY